MDSGKQTNECSDEAPRAMNQQLNRHLESQQTVDVNHTEAADNGSFKVQTYIETTMRSQ